MSAIFDLQRTIRCPICLDYFTDPVSLTVCSHSFCKACLNSAFELRETCPLCIIKITKQNIISNYYLTNIIQNISNLVDYTISQSSSTANVSESVPIINPSKPLKSFEIGQVIEVLPRTWAGINKPGGHGRVINITTDSITNEVFYDIKYILTNTKEKRIPSLFIESSEDLTRNERTEKQRTKSKYVYMYFTYIFIYYDSVVYIQIYIQIAPHSQIARENVSSRLPIIMLVNEKDPATVLVNQLVVAIAIAHLLLQPPLHPLRLPLLHPCRLYSCPLIPTYSPLSL